MIHKASLLYILAKGARELTSILVDCYGYPSDDPILEKYIDRIREVALNLLLETGCSIESDNGKIIMLTND